MMQLKHFYGISLLHFTSAIHCNDLSRILMASQLISGVRCQVSQLLNCKLSNK